LFTLTQHALLSNTMPRSFRYLAVTLFRPSLGPTFVPLSRTTSVPFVDITVKPGKLTIDGAMYDVVPAVDDKLHWPPTLTFHLCSTPTPASLKHSITVCAVTIVHLDATYTRRPSASPYTADTLSHRVRAGPMFHPVINTLSFPDVRCSVAPLTDEIDGRPYDVVLALAALL
jgi:hypothetical protein